MPPRSPTSSSSAASTGGVASSLFDRPYLLLTLTALFWSGNFVLGRAVHGSVPPVGLAFWRWAGATLILLGPAWSHLRRDRAVLAASWPIVLVLSALGVAVFNTLVYIGLQTTSALNAVLMQSTMPVMIVALGFVVFHDGVTILQALGVALSLSGAVAIVARGNPAALAGLALNRGDLWIALAVASYSAYSVLLRRRPAVHPLSLLVATFLPGSLMILPFYLWESLSGRPIRLDPPSLLAIGYVAVFPSILAYFCFNRGVELVGANRAGLFIHLMPVFGSIMAVLFLGERFEPFHAAGIALILAGIVLATRRSRGDGGTAAPATASAPTAPDRTQ
ncbi:MAG TPA: DMT family transporter [Stellaceae bacterium]